MRDKSILKHLEEFDLFNGVTIVHYPTREGLFKFVQAGGITVSWYNRGKIGVQIGENDTIACGVRELSGVIIEALTQ